MTLSGTDVLLVGHSFQGAHKLNDQLGRWGFRCYFARTMQAAYELLSSVRIDVVLSDTHLSDGTGFGLLRVLAGLPVSVYFCLPVEKSCFWLPALDAGKECLGLPALRPWEFANELEEMANDLGAVPAGDHAVPKGGAT